MGNSPYLTQFTKISQFGRITALEFRLAIKSNVFLSMEKFFYIT